MRKPTYEIVDNLFTDRVLWAGLLDGVYMCRLNCISEGKEGLLEVVVEHMDTDFPLIRKYITYNQHDVDSDLNEYLDKIKQGIEAEIEVYSEGRYEAG